MSDTASTQLDDFGKGKNTFSRDTMIQDSETPECLNVWGVGKNSVAKRAGTVLKCEVSGANKVVGIGTFYSSSVRELLIMAGGKLRKEANGVATQIDTDIWTEDKRTDFCQAGGKVFIQNNTEALREYNGSNIIDTVNGQKGLGCIFYQGCLWTWGVSTDITRLYRSGTSTKLGDFVYNDPNNLLATSVFVGKDDGQAIRGCFKHQDNLYIIKENSIWSVTQDSTATGVITLELIDPSRGVANHFTIDSVDNDVFLFNDKGVYAFGYEPNITNQIRTNIVSLRVNSSVKAIEKNRLDDVSGIYFENRYYLSYTSGGGGHNDSILVYDRQLLGWWVFSGLSVNCFTEFKDSNGNTRLYCGSDTDGKVFYFDETVKSDNGIEIPTFWKSPKLSFRNYAQKKFFLFFMMYFAKKQGDISISVYIDGTLISTTSLVIGNTGSAGISIGSIGTYRIGVEGGNLTISDVGGGDFFKIPINKIGRNIQLSISNTSNSQDWELNSLDFNIKMLSKNYQ